MKSILNVIAGRQVAAFTRQPMQFRRKDQIADHDGGHEMQARYPRIADPVGGTGECEKGITAVLRGKKCQKKHGKTEAPSRQIKILQCVFAPRTPRDPAYDQ